MKYTARHGRLWELVDRIQTAPDMRRTVHGSVSRKVYIPEVRGPRKERELKNAFRL